MLCKDVWNCDICILVYRKFTHFGLCSKQGLAVHRNVVNDDNIDFLYVFFQIRFAIQGCAHLWYLHFGISNIDTVLHLL